MHSMRAIERVFLGVLVTSAYATLYAAGPPGAGCAAAAVDVSFRPDDATGLDRRTADVYDAVRYLLAYKMLAWLATTERLRAGGRLRPYRAIRDVADYLGFPGETADAIDVAVTLLVEKQLSLKTIGDDDDGRTPQPRVDNVLEAYFYACDVQNMLDAESSLTAAVETVANDFERLLRKLAVNRTAVGGAARTEAEFADRLLKSLAGSVAADRAATVHARSVTVRAMKNDDVHAWADECPPSNAVTAVIGRLWPVRGDPGEIVGRAVIDNHRRFLRAIVPEAFGFLYNHLQLLVECRARGHHRDGQLTPAAVFGLRGFLEKFRALFVDRFFYLAGRTADDALRDAVDPLQRFMSGGGGGGGAAGDDTIADYRTDRAEYETEMLKRANDARSEILRVFFAGGHASAVDRGAAVWEATRATRIDFDYRNRRLFGKHLLFGYMERNAENAFAVLDAFERRLVPEETVRRVSGAAFVRPPEGE